jgi:hypothetical protein
VDALRWRLKQAAEDEQVDVRSRKMQDLERRLRETVEEGWIRENNHRAQVEELRAELLRSQVSGGYSRDIQLTHQVLVQSKKEDEIAAVEQRLAHGQARQPARRSQPQQGKRRKTLTAYMIAE